MDSEKGKVFIGGISVETTEERLKDYFKTFGDVVEAVVVKDRLTGRSRGFGFLVFADPAVADRLLFDSKHIIDSQMFFHYIGKGPADVAGTDPPVGGGIHGHTGPSSKTKIPRSDGGDPLEFVATDPSVGGGIHEGIGPADYPEIPDPSLGREIHLTLDGTEASASLPIYASPPRHVVDKGHVYTRQQTPQKIELTQEDLASMVDAVVDAAFVMATSHTEAPAAGVVPAPPPGPTIIDVQPTALSATQGTQSQLGPYVVESPNPIRRRLNLSSPWPPPRPPVWDPSLYNDPGDSLGKGKGEGKRKRDD